MTMHNQIFKNKWLVTISSLCFGLMLFSSNPAYSLSKQQFLGSMLPDSCSFSGSFKRSKKIKAIPEPLISIGDFLYSCKLGLIWETRSPIQESLVFSAEKLNFLVKDEKTAENLESVQHDFLAKLLFGLMSADIQQLETEFDLELGETDTNKTVLTLVPTGELIKEAILTVELERSDDLKSLIITITDDKEQETTIKTTEVARYSDDTDFKTRCKSLQYLNLACGLLIDPRRVTNN